jgi:uncharacterized protein (UPF0548 family)
LIWRQVKAALFSLQRSSEEAIREHLGRQSQEPFSYPDVGCSKEAIRFRGYALDHNRVLLGHGASVFRLAKAALERWEMFNLGWVQLCWPSTQVTVGAIVGVLAQALGIWSLNACRVVYTLDETGWPKRFGFAYGTLPDHAESGEERFSVEWHRGDDSVWYDLLAFSRPHHLAAKLGYPYTRSLQKHFAADSLRAMVRAATSS